MKTISTLFLSLLFSLTAFAGDGAELKGKDADAILNMLMGSGAHVDCSRMRCGTTASEITCSKEKSKKNSATCALLVQNSHGTETKRRILGAGAELLMETLMNEDFGGCGMESCQAKANLIDCSFSSPDAILANTSCSFQ